MSCFQKGVVGFRMVGNCFLQSINPVTASSCSGIHIRAMSTTYKFTVSEKDLDTVNATFPAVAEAGTDLTKHFYTRMFKAHPELLNLFNQTNQKLGGQPMKLLKTVAFAATAALETGELPYEAIEGINHKHCALNIGPEAYAIVGEHILGTIEDKLTDDEAVLAAWGALYGDIAGAFAAQEKELYEEMANTPGGWLGRRQFSLAKKEELSDTISRFKFVPTDGKDTPLFKPGKFTTVWAKVNASGPYDSYTEQPRHYTLAVPRNPADAGKALSVSIKRDGLVSNLLHDAAVGSRFDLSAPYGCFNLSGVENLWLSDVDAPVVFLSAGVGITPVLAMLENIYLTRPATWLHSAKNGGVHAYRDRLREITAVRGGQLQRRVWYDDPLPEDGPPGGFEDPSDKMYNVAKYHYHSRMDLPKVANDFPPEILHLGNKYAQYYMCGPPAWTETQRKGLESLGVGEDRIHWEGF